MIVLALDNSTDEAGVALVAADALLFLRRVSARRGDSGELYGALQEAVRVGRPQRIAVGLGPGSYSGVRVAISVATGLGLALGVEVVGFPSIASLDVPESKYRVIGDARRGSYFIARSVEGALAGPPELIDADDLPRVLSGGEGPVYTCDAGCTVAGVERAVVDPVRLARLAEARGPVANDALEPLYLKAPHITQARTS